MDALTVGWTRGLLDYTPLEGERLVDVHGWVEVAPVPEQYFVRERDWRVLSGYVAAYGVRGAAAKVRSRLAESGRNVKRVSVGVGRVAGTGEPVCFVACNHPRCVTRLAVPPSLTAPWPHALPPPLQFVAAEAGGAALADGQLASWAGWLALCGEPPPDALSWLGLRTGRVAELLSSGQEVPVSHPPVRQRSPQTEGSAAPGGPDGELDTIVFGYGNHTKTAILPFLDARLRLQRVHDIDPVQLGTAEGSRVELDTSPVLRPADRPAFVVGAGYHHTHAPLAVEAVARGAAVAIEKPLATTMEQYESLVGAAERGRVFGGFHRRYALPTVWAHEDLAPLDGAPVSYHAIVFEVPLPSRHWYRWPASGTRLLSNGCHWIDHFLLFNDYAAVRSQEVQESSNGDVFVTIELVNGASFSLVLTEHGSARVGLRETVELRSRDRTIRIVDSERYAAEDGRRVIRRRRHRRNAGHGRMYRAISKAVADGDPGDAMRTFASSRVSLELDARLRRLRGRG